jgi:coenzyme F420-reducing hydrogenase beta subunit
MEPSPEFAVKPVSPRDVIDSALCIGCGACAAGGAAEMRWDANGFLKPSGPKAWRDRPSEPFSQTCPFSPLAADEDAIAAERFPAAAVHDKRIGRFERAYVGSVAEGEWRARGSSGGMVSWVAGELLRIGEIDAVVHVKPSDPAATGRLFRYGVSRTLEEIAAGAKSRYYPIDLAEVLDEIRSREGGYAVVGIPCFIQAVHPLRGAEPLLASRITHTLGLFCGHMKSARLVESFAWQLGTELDKVRALDYRVKDPARPANWYRARLDLADGSSVAEDWWQFADGDWGAGFFQNPACDFCDDVVAETADIAFGDAWVEPYSSDGRGTNVVIVRDERLRDLLDRTIGDGRLALQRVGANFIADTQAAGLRHRRQGLACRLSWRRGGHCTPRKRVQANSETLSLRRRLIFRLRAGISRWSHRVMWLARAWHVPELYLAWARFWLRLYQGLAWSNGRVGAIADHLFRK